MRGFVRTLGQRQKVLFIGFVYNCGFEVRLSHTASRRDRQTAQHKQYVHHRNCRGGGVEQLKCVRCNKQCEPMQPTKLVVVFLGGAIGCSGLLPIVHGTRGFALTGLMPMLSLSRWLLL